MTEALLTKKKVMDLFTEEGLVKQTGAEKGEWDLYVLKELIDNGLDACESDAIEPKIEVIIKADGITVRDNGPGITRETVDKIVDLNVYAGNKSYYARPSRGKQGNALLTLLSMVYVLSKGNYTKCGVIHSGNKQYAISLQHDDVEQDFKFIVDEFELPESVQGTEIKINVPFLDPSQYAIGERDLYRINYLINGFAAFNPHAKINSDYFGRRVEVGDY